MLRVAGLSKVFPGGAVALQGVDLEVPRGQFCALLGPSGSGKSTLLRAINGLVEPGAGSIALDGTRLSKRALPAIRRRIGMVHQDFGLVPRLPVLDNVLCGALGRIALWRVVLRAFPPAWQERAFARLDQVGLGPEHVRRQARNLSGGQQQRVAVARAFVADPELILADEPVASLDPGTSHEILALLRAAASERQVTVLCSLHQVDYARRFADRIVALRKGEIAFDGPSDAFGDDRVAEIYGEALGAKLREGSA